MTITDLEEDRLDALNRLQILDTPPEDRYDRVVRITQSLFNVPMVGVALIDRRRQWHKAAVGLAQELPRDIAFCDHTIRTPGPLVVEDATLDARFADNPLVTGQPRLRFYAGQPLRAPDGQRVGSLCIGDSSPRQMSTVEIDLLRDLADWVEKELANDGELVRASEVQHNLLPQVPPVIPGYEVAGRCFPAREVGGDFFDYYLVGDSLQLTIADVMGKGIGAAIIAAGVRTLLRGANRFNGVAEAVNRANYSLSADLAQTSAFVTLFCARLEPATGVLTYVDAGHGLAAIITRSGDTRPLRSNDLPLGALAEDTWESHVTELAPGDTLLAVSDGLLDYFPTPAEAAEALAELAARGAAAAELIELVGALSNGHQVMDDLTVVVLRRLCDV